MTCTDITQSPLLERGLAAHSPAAIRPARANRSGCPPCAYVARTHGMRCLSPFVSTASPARSCTRDQTRNAAGLVACGAVSTDECAAKAATGAQAWEAYDDYGWHRCVCASSSSPPFAWLVSERRSVVYSPCGAESSAKCAAAALPVGAHCVRPADLRPFPIPDPRSRPRPFSPPSAPSPSPARSSSTASPPCHRRSTRHHRAPGRAAPSALARPSR
jgi:hypothetical protein